MKEFNVSLFKEVSAKTGDHVGQAFKMLGERLMSKNRKKEAEKGKMVLGM